VSKGEYKFAQHYVFHTPDGKILGKDGIDSVLRKRESNGQYAFTSQSLPDSTHVACPIGGCRVHIAAEEVAVLLHLQNVHSERWMPTRVRELLARSIKTTR
jgi:hypothetical protein